ncbi:Uncharacterised protein [Mycobacteroides abscessus subsp. abscessus]|nr:Uncharacterised protein [Mycobacteroides abscessus subsp. abscessus]
MGLAVRRAAAAPGVIISDITSSAPMICTPCAHASPIRIAKITESVRIGTPFASATRGSIDAKSSGR